MCFVGVTLTLSISAQRNEKITVDNTYHSIHTIYCTTTLKQIVSKQIFPDYNVVKCQLDSQKVSAKHSQS